jgi:hypothetical protein
MTVTPPPPDSSDDPGANEAANNDTLITVTKTIEENLRYRPKIPI